MIIGITGQTASGKSTVSKFLKEKYEFKYIEVDKIVEKIMKQGGIDKIRDYLYSEHQVDSKGPKEIGDSFFSYDINSYIMDLNFKREIDNEILKEIRKYDENDIIIVDWMMLEDSFIFSKCDLLIKTEIDYELRKKRYVERGDNFNISKYCCIDNIHHPYNDSRYHYKVDTTNNWEIDLSNFIESSILGKKLVSIIVPVYNVEQYLMRCVDSILNQSYKNIEVILVNDGSTDNSLEVCKVLTKKDKRVKIINQQNLGLSEARNTGLKNAIGDYIGFVDSDDYIESRMIENLLLNAEQSNADISCGRAFIHSRNGVVRHPNNNPKEITTICNKDKLIKAYLDGPITMAAWDKLYKRETLNGIYFDKNTFNEDADFILKLCLANKKFVCDSRKYYHYVKRNEGSLTGSKFNKRCFLTQIWGKKAYSQILSLGKEFQDDAERCLFNSLAHVLKMYMKDYTIGKIKNSEYKDQIQTVAIDIINLLLNTKNVKKFRDLDNVLSIINKLIDDNILDKNKMPTINIPCIGILWNSLDRNMMEEAIRMLSSESVINDCVFVDLDKDYRKFIEEIYLYNNEKVGIPVFKSSILIDKYDSNNIAVINMIIRVSNYIFYNDKKGYLFKEISELKEYIRNFFKDKIKDYAYDNIFHLTVDQDEYEYTDEVCKKYLKEYKGNKNGQG